MDAETGEEFDFTAEQVVELAQYGLSEHSKKKKGEKPKEEELSMDDKYNELKQQIVNMETRTKNEKQGQLVLNILSKSAEKFDLTKDGGPLTDKIKMMTLLRLNQNPRLDPAVLFAEETKSYMEILEKMNGKQIANDKVRGALTGTLRGGSIPAIDTNKKYTVKDLKGSGSREAMRLFLESQE